MLLFADLFSIDNLDPVTQIKLLKNELNSYKDDLTQKVSWIICNKTDLLKQEDLPEIQQNLEKEFGIKSDSIFFISAATGEGTSELLGKLETEILRNKSLEG